MEDYALVIGLIALGACFGGLIVYAWMVDRIQLGDIAFEEPPFPIGAMPGDTILRTWNKSDETEQRVGHPL
jgi:hypothetical protein